MARSRHRVALITLAVLLLGVTGFFDVSSKPAPAQRDLTVGAESEPPRIDPILDWSTRRLAEMTTEEKVRSVLIVHVPGVDPDAMRAAVEVVSAGGSGFAGLILMRDNVPGSADELTALTAYVRSDLPAPPVIAIDEEGGDVTRLPYDDFAGADYLRSAPPSETADAFGGRGELLRSVGVNLNFGIVADITSERGSFMFWRSLGGDPAAAAERVAAAVTGETVSVASTLKHFPGHGRSDADSHSGIPTTEVSFDEWLATDAVPFHAGVTAGAAAVMFGHLAFPSIDPAPATLSTTWHDVLRQDLDFSGLAITDDMLMLQASGLPEYADPYRNAVAALNAGNDALLYVLPGDLSNVGIDMATLVSVLATGVDPARLEEAALRMMMFRRSLAPDALTWTPPCDTVCVGDAVGGHSSSEQVAPLLRADSSKN